MSQTKVSRDSRVDDLSRLDPGPQATTISMVEFSPHSDHFLCVSRNSVYVWDVVTGGLRSTFSGHSDIVKNISFSPDGHLIASASYDGTIRLWDIATGMLHHMMVVNGSSHGVFYGNGLFDSPVVCRSGVRQLGFRRSGVRRSGVGGIGTDSAWAPIRRRSLFVTNPWITYRMDRILWLPVEYRATCVTVHVATLVLGHSSGELTVIEFDVSRIPVRAS
jgi:FOG: WD40 repeat